MFKPFWVEVGNVRAFFYGFSWPKGEPIGKAFYRVKYFIQDVGLGTGG